MTKYDLNMKPEFKSLNNHVRIVKPVAYSEGANAGTFGGLVAPINAEINGLDFLRRKDVKHISDKKVYKAEHVRVLRTF